MIKQFLFPKGWDLFFLAILGVLSYFLISFYAKFPYINTGYPDWVVHAFRIKSLEDFGMISWTHVWSNGISLWRAYQFFPHYMTLAVVKLFDVSVVRGMVLITIGLFIALRFFMYLALRCLHFSPITAFVGAVLSLDIAQYWGGVSDFSLMFGFVFFPLMILGWVKYYEGKIQYLFPYFVGLSFYMHIILGYTSMALWAMAVIFSSRKIFSFSVVVQFFIILATSSLFWLPIIHKASYEYTSPVFANKYFLNLTLSGYQYYGLSLVILLCLAACTALIFIPLRKEYRYAKILFLFMSLFFLLVVVGLTYDLPRAIAQLQFTRGATLIGIGVIFSFAPIVEYLRTISSSVIKGVLLFLLCLVITEGMWFTSIYSPAPSQELSEPVSGYLQQNPQRKFTDGAVWTSALGPSSYYAPNRARFPYSYMGHLDSNQVSPRISPLVLYSPFSDQIPYANIVRLNDYFKITGVKYIFFDNDSPFTRTVLSSEQQIYKDGGEFKVQDATYHFFEVPWEVKNAILINPSHVTALKPFPTSLELSETGDQIKLDDYVKKFLQTLSQSDNQTLHMTYPTQESLAVAIPANRDSHFVYMNESFDSGWKAYFNNQQVKLQAVGPNYMLAQLQNTSAKGILYFQHSWPVSFYISWYCILLIPLEIALFYFIKKHMYETH